MASVAVVNHQGDLVFYRRSEDYSGIKGDKDLNNDVILDAKKHLDSDYQIHYFEKPILKYLRQLRSGESNNWRTIRPSYVIGQDNHKLLDSKPIHTHRHHLSHCAGAFQTSEYNDATVVVIDAIGEFDTITIWSAQYDYRGNTIYKLLWNQTYPDSIGLLYSAMTQAIGLKPLRDEYQLMQMSKDGNRTTDCVDLLLNNIIDNLDECTLRHNIHIGIPPEILCQILLYSDSDIAASTQAITERLINSVLTRASNYKFSNNLVYTGGVALNSIANQNLHNYFDNYYIPRDPGDSGSSIGACALGLGRKIYI
jgi:carbamoyltransferase